jgi:hypothetical protein
MSKYQALTDYLKGQSGIEVVMTFDQVAKKAGMTGMKSLPKSAVLYRMWWSNDPSHHVQAKAWLEAGYKVAHVDMDTYKVTFKPVQNTEPPVSGGMAEEAHEFKLLQNAGEKKQNRHPALGAMRGTFTIEPGYDLTRPVYSDEEWAEIEKEMSEDWDQIEQGMSGGNK